MRFDYSKRYFLLPLTLIFGLIFQISACAREQSKGDKEEEEREREISRLEHAESQFTGTVTTASDGTIPFALTFNVNRNPEAEDAAPGLVARMRLGLLGGVDLTTEAVEFDYGSGRITASFGGGKAGEDSNGNALELQGFISGKDLQEARLTAASGKVYDVKAKAADELDLTEHSVELRYAIRIKQSIDGKIVDALLSLDRRPGDDIAPASSDIPRLPKINGSLRFPGAARVAHAAETVAYDALTDTLDIYFPGGNGLRLAFTKLSKLEGGLPLTFVTEPQLSGSAVLGSRTIGTVTLSPRQNQVITNTLNSQIPRKTFVGTFTATNGAKWPVVANATYSGEEGSSGNTTPFSRFPGMRLQVDICIRGQSLDTKNFTLASVDYMSSEATFSMESASSRVIANFSDSWSKIHMEILEEEIGGGGDSTALDLQAAEETERTLTCADSTAPEALTRLLGFREGRSPRTGRNLNFREGSGSNTDPNQPIDAPYLTYEGYLTRNNGSAVPIGISIFPRQNPGGGTDEPSLQVTARIGFFGGANLASEPAVFSWGSGRISASFVRPNGAPLELRGILEPDTLRDAVLIGPNLGQSSLVVRSGVEPYTHTGLEAVFNTAIAKGAGPVDPDQSLQSVLTLRSRSEGTTAPANIDLPVLPSLEASLRVDGLGQTPQVGSKVIYDVLRGTIEIFFSDSSVLEFKDIFLKPTGVTARPFQTFSNLAGRLILGGQPVAAVNADDVTTGGRWDVQNLPYTIYIGTYQGGGTTQRLKALARVDYPGNAGRNTAEYPFQTFPNLQATVTLCLGNSAFSRRELELEAVDYLDRRLVFKNRGTGARNALEVAFEPRWMKLSGEFRDTDGSSGDTQGSQLDLTALPNASNIDCSTPMPTP